ncbi:GNAT family N-acetyltransferase [Frigoribacterium sp. CG_9.8]|uniref:GNAT family N-acetyltransferase n=1 Tax=Frigoribacterium sp. CG_9.8 TaxID=2787733 RepID=UPI0018CAD22B|nr:GNAT family N-acetyltransferase [Frigoribacterium sp. CG_9.8]MBG6107892.1 N-acetylglutamate synthase-like GNAT family acetyltransferase [Frigoribacterium sp. CG_9.8]
MSTTAETSPASPSIVRLAAAADVDAVFALVEQLGIGEKPVRESFAGAFEHAVEPSRHHMLLVAELDGVVSAYAYTTIARLLYTNGDSAQLQELAVNTPARDRGLGSLLVAAIEEECRSRGVRQLTVASSHAARFYERLDYRSTSDFLKKRFTTD